MDDLVRSLVLELEEGVPGVPGLGERGLLSRGLLEEVEGESKGYPPPGSRARPALISVLWATMSCSERLYR